MHSTHIKNYIAKKDLTDKATYIGECRNAKEALWVADIGKFVYKRTKFGSEFFESICHPDDDKAHDVFYPITLKEPDGK